MTDEPADPDREDNLGEPLDDDRDVGARGRFGGRARAHSPQFWATTHRSWLAALAAGAVALLGWLLADRGEEP
jgi:hypothetical protein